VQFIPGGKSLWVGLGMHKVCVMSSVMQTCQNDLGFSLYAVLSVCCVVVTSDEWMKFEIKVSLDVGVLPLNTGDLLQP